MAKKKGIQPSMPSKAYLVSFGDTMTALLAFFIVLNSLATEQTGAKMHAGTGSFVRAFSKSGSPGEFGGNRSRQVISQQYQKPIYALPSNADSSKHVGPDDTDEREAIQDREKEQFQKFLTEVETAFGLRTGEVVKDQTAFDSFEPVKMPDGEFSRHGLELISQALAKLRDPKARVEVILWAEMPSGSELQRKLELADDFREHVEQVFWLKAEDKRRINFRAKPWLFSDAKRPKLSVVVATTQ